MASILSTGISALTAFQRQLATTGHNIANVNTEGYSRQTLDFDARVPQEGGVGFLGSGVEVSSIARNYDNFLAGRVRSFNASEAEFSIYHDRASQIDRVIGDEAAGLDQMIQQFFASVHDVASDPSSIPARNVMLNRSELLTDRFQSLNGWLDDLRLQAGRDFETFVSQVNGISQSIAAVNQRIQEASNVTSNPPNDLLDERDKLIDQLSEYVNVDTVQQNDGSVNVFIGNGQSMVVGAAVNSLTVTNNPAAADHKELAIALAGGGSAVITDQITGGKLGGLLRFRSQVLDPTQNSLGLVALGLADAFNAEHVTGMDLDGDLGQNYFSTTGPEVLAHPSNSGTVTAAFDAITDVNNHEYELSYDGTNWSISDLSDGSSSVLGPAGPFTHDGVTYTIGAGAAAGDSYRIRPARQGASALGVLITNTRDIAAAESVRTDNVASNSGTAQIGAGAQTSSTGTTQLAAPITLTFNAALNQFNLSSGGTIAYNPATNSGDTLTVSIAGLGDFSFKMTGTPANGDQFTLSDNTGGIGDNRNAQRLAGLQNNTVLFGNTATLSEAYGFLVADVGTETQQAGANAAVQSQLLTQAENAKDSVSGVNLDEEAADLVRYQQAYAAAAQVISTANTLFDTLIGAVRR